MGCTLHRGRRSGRRSCSSTEACIGGGRMGGTILCDVTDSPEGRSAAECAHVLGARLGLRVVLVCVVEEVTPAARESVTGRQRQSGAERTVEAIARELGNGAETRVAIGDQAEAL